MNTRFRLFINGSAAADEVLAAVEEVTVEQEMDAIWEARIQFFNCVSPTGAWMRSGDATASPFSRLRVEVWRGADPWLPLIDGPVANYENHYASEPGASRLEVVVRDDTVYLNQRSANVVYDSPPKSDAELVRSVLGEAGVSMINTGSPEIDPGASSTPRPAVQRGTPMQFLRELAAARHWHAYVLPGRTDSDKSRFCFRSEAAVPDGLPAMVLLGSNRNLIEFNVHTNAEGPRQSTSASLSFRDGNVASASTMPTEHPLMAALPAIPENLAGLREIPPDEAVRQEPATLTAGAAGRSSYALSGTGRVAPCYPGVLEPYRAVHIEIGGSTQSSTFLLKKVRHRLTRNVYTQEFEVLGNSLVAPGGSGAPATGLGLAASASLSLV